LFSRSTASIAAISLAVSPFIRIATRNAPTCAGVAAPEAISSMHAAACSSESSSRSTSLVTASRIVSASVIRRCRPPLDPVDDYFPIAVEDAVHHSHVSDPDPPLRACPQLLRTRRPRVSRQCFNRRRNAPPVVSWQRVQEFENSSWNDDPVIQSPGFPYIPGSSCCPTGPASALPIPSHRECHQDRPQ